MSNARLEMRSESDRHWTFSRGFSSLSRVSHSISGRETVCCATSFENEGVSSMRRCETGRHATGSSVTAVAFIETRFRTDSKTETGCPTDRIPYLYSINHRVLSSGLRQQIAGKSIHVRLLKAPCTFLRCCRNSATCSFQFAHDSHSE